MVAFQFQVIKEIHISSLVNMEDDRDAKPHIPAKRIGVLYEVFLALSLAAELWFYWKYGLTDV